MDRQSHRARGSSKVAIGSRRRGRLHAALAALAFLWLVPARTVQAAEGVASVELWAEPSQVWDVLSDLEAWSTIFPSIARIQVSVVDSHHVRLSQVTRALGMTVAYTTLATLFPDEGRLELVLDSAEPHDVEQVVVSWSVVSWEGRGSRVELRSRVVSGRPIPGFIEGRLVRRSVRESLQALVEEVERRADLPRLAASR
jgi:hypothetical protein